MSGALDRVVGRLRCPHCGAPLTRDGAVLGCATGHRYDIARDGHVTLLPPGGRRHGGDTPAMVAARAEFFAAGHFAPLTAAIADAARAGAARSAAVATRASASGAGATDAARSAACVVDVGAGTGEHLAGVLAALPEWNGIALDAAPAALRRAQRADPRIAAVGCDAWQPLPLRDDAADLIMCVFAPRSGAELPRILAPDGALVAVTPAEHHLAELRALAGTLQVGADKQERLRTALPGLAHVARRELEFALALGRDDLRAVVAMGPTAWHVAPDELDRRVARAAVPLRATAAVVIDTFSDRPAASRSG